MNDIGVIAIGRNEGERLRRCLASIAGRGMPIVYVDSASTDDSPKAAGDAGAEVVHLDMSLPFSAARARNEGFVKLLEIAPAIRHVQFVDGDCEMVAGWIETAAKTLDADEKIAVVCGRRRERFPQASIYNRVADIEWNTPIGEAKSCGGDAMMRAGAFQQAGGFDPSIVAGEEPELCQRLRAAGWKILRIDAEMTLHDSAMLRFRQWWMRSIRSGYGAMDVATRFGNESTIVKRATSPRLVLDYAGGAMRRDGLFVKQVQSARLWVYGWPAAMILAAIIVLPFGGPKWALATMGVVFAALPLQMLRTARGVRRRAKSWLDAGIYGMMAMIGKWANVLGQRQYLRDRAAGRITRSIDYKTENALSPRMNTDGHR